MGLTFSKPLFSFTLQWCPTSLLSCWYHSYSLRQAINRVIINILKKNPQNSVLTHFLSFFLIPNEDNFVWEATMSSLKDCCRYSTCLLLLQLLHCLLPLVLLSWDLSCCSQMTHSCYSTPHILCPPLSWLYHHEFCHNSEAPLKKLLLLWSFFFHCIQL